MKIKFKEGHAGVITLLNGEVFNYGLKRYILKTNNLVYYTGKALRELFKINSSEGEKVFISKILELSKKELQKLDYIGKVKISDVASYT